MNLGIHIGRKIVLPVLLVTLIVYACKKDDLGIADNLYLVEFEPVSLLSIQSVDALITFLEAEYPQAAGIKDYADYPVQVLRMVYKTHYRGSEVHASGLVCLPTAAGKFPIISFQNGTNTRHDYAPSADPLNSSYMLIESMASNGYIVLIPDYIGFGASSSEVHPYYQKESTWTAVIDMIHAGNELVQDRTILAKANDEYYLMGYSQGGWSTLSVLEELEKNGPAELSVSAASCGAGAYDLMDMAQYLFGLETFPSPLYLPYFVYGEQVFGALDDPLDKYFNQPYASIIPQLFDGSHTNGEVNAGLNDTISRLLTSGLLENFSSGEDFRVLRNVLTENSITAWQVDARLRYYHGTADMDVPPGQSLSMYEEFIQAGSDPLKVEHFVMDGLDHGAGVILWGIETINWFNQMQDK